MALYWPEQHVALDIIDDPARRPFEGDESYTVLRVTCADLEDYDSYYKIMTRLCALLGREMPEAPEWEQGNRALHDAMFRWDFEEDVMSGCWACGDDVDPDMASDESLDSVEILAPDAETGEHMRAFAEQEGRYVRNVSVWEGPTPEGSYEDIGSSMRMSTPEFFFLRKANQLPFADAVTMGNELCGKYRTQITQYDRDDGYDFLARPRTNKAHLRRYLRGARGTKEGKRAKRILRHVVDDCGSPMGSYLSMLLCLPILQGGYGLEHALMSAALDSDGTLMPSSDGPYLAYDLCWPRKKCALQYTGRQGPTKRAHAALQAGGMHVLCVTDKDVADPDRFDKYARKLARRLDASVPEPDDERWLAARDKLRHHLKPPQFDCMRITLEDLSEHR